MSDNMPALSLVAMPGRRKATIELAQEIERRGFAGIYCPSIADSLSFCLLMAANTKTLRFGTSITPIYTRPVQDYAQTAAVIHEISDGRFQFGVGVSHAPALKRMGLTGGKRPLSDIREFVSQYRAVERTGDKAPIIIATLRQKMIALAEEIADGMVFANASRSHMATSLNALSAAKRASADFYIGNMIPTCINDDVERAKAVNRKTLSSYALLPNYRNYWKEAGYVEEMEAVEKCVAENRLDDVAGCLSDQWLADNTLFGSVSQVRDGVAAWQETGVNSVILVPSSAEGNQLKALDEMFQAFS